MFYRCLAIMLASCLPTAAAIFPMGPAHTANAVIAGTLGTVLAAFALVSDRARLGAALIGFWVALSAFIFSSTLLEEFITVSWGVLMFVWMIGPLSVAPRVSRVRIPEATPQPSAATAADLPLAA